MNAALRVIPPLQVVVVAAEWPCCARRLGDLNVQSISSNLEHPRPSTNEWHPRLALPAAASSGCRAHPLCGLPAPPPKQNLTQ